MDIVNFENIGSKINEIICSKEFYKLQKLFNKCEHIFFIGNGGNLAIADHAAIDTSRLTNKNAKAPGSGILTTSIIADTNSLGHNEVTDGSRVTFAVGLATIKAARAAIKEMCKRASLIWGIDEDAVRWENGSAIPAGPNAGQFDPMSIEEIAALSSQTGGPIAGHHEVNAEGAGVSFGFHLADVEVDKETGSTKVLRYTVFQDAGKAIHPSYVEGQMQGGAVQGIGWALNEEYFMSDDGKMLNSSYLDYRMPIALDLPMIETVLVEVPSEDHPFGVRGVGETPICPPVPAISNAVNDAIGTRILSTPIKASKILNTLKSM